LVINFDGLGSSKTTSICDGAYGKIATFAPGGITFNKPLNVDSITAGSVNAKLKRSTTTLEIGEGTVVLNGSKTSYSSDTYTVNLTT
jgi:hypothetical protein